MQRWVFVATAAVLAFLHTQVLNGLDAQAVSHPQPPGVPRLPVALITGGLRARSAADVQWVLAAQYAGDARFPGHPGLDRMVGLVVDLDPAFLEAYSLGALLLSSEPQHVDAAVDLLRRGERQFPLDWTLPFYGGAVAFASGDVAVASTAWARAATLAGAPDWLGSLAARLRVQEGDCAGALNTFQTLLRSVPQDVRKVLVRQEPFVRLECMLHQLDRAAGVYQQRTGAPPGGMADLVEAGLVPAGVKDPWGQPFRLGADGRFVGSQALPRRSHPGPAPNP